ncbi:MAG: TIGR02996 domain-containing protein [Gemmataceae bacterium]
MNDLEGLLDDIRQNPEDDTPRLVAADWFEDAGQQERAELIRLQVAQSRLIPAERNPAIEKRIDQLITSHSRKWLKLPPSIGSVTWERGFPATLHTSANKFLSRAEELVRLFPGLRLTNVQSKLNALAQCPALQRVRHLEIQKCRSSPQQWREFLRSPHLCGLRQLGFIQCELQASHYQEIADAPVFHQLESLEIVSRFAPPNGLRYLRHFNERTFRRLSLRGHDLGPAGVDILADLPGLRNLTELDLSYCQLDERAGQRLAQFPPFNQLAFLNLHFSTLHREGATAIAESSILDHVERLEIGFNEITNQGIQAILNSSRLTKLRQLNISHSEGTQIMGRHLACSPLLHQLRVLALHYNSIGDQGLENFLKTSNLSNLIALDLRSCELTATGAQKLAETPELQHLRVLWLSGNSLGAKGAMAFIQSPYLQNLWLLSGDQHTFSRRGLERLQTHFRDRIRDC